MTLAPAARTCCIREAATWPPPTTKACLSLSCHAMSKEPGVCEAAGDVVSMGGAEMEMEG